mmetsp:Transcript_47664/g.83914  ORF Transcript_47664/g.83914 Transcript_47664/m.83914 type:complete len:89 (+) Transcript_47664:530-796(+)
MMAAMPVLGEPVPVNAGARGAPPRAARTPPQQLRGGPLTLLPNPHCQEPLPPALHTSNEAHGTPNRSCEAPLCNTRTLATQGGINNEC